MCTGVTTRQACCSHAQQRCGNCELPYMGACTGFHLLAKFCGLLCRQSCAAATAAARKNAGHVRVLRNQAARDVPPASCEGAASRGTTEVSHGRHLHAQTSQHSLDARQLSRKDGSQIQLVGLCIQVDLRRTPQSAPCKHTTQDGEYCHAQGRIRGALLSSAGLRHLVLLSCVGRRLPAFASLSCAPSVT